MTDLSLTPTHSPARLWIIRHGQTDWNLEGRIQGHTPTHLNDTGRQQAADLARYFSQKPFKAIYASDLPRAYETADVIAQELGLKTQRTPAFRERHLGQCEGKTTSEIAELRRHAGSGDLADWTGVPGVEQDEPLWARVSSELKTVAQRFPAQDVLIVTHGGVIKQIVYHILGIPKNHKRRFSLSNGITLVLETRTDGFHLLSLVDMALLVDHAVSPDTATVPKGM